METLFDLYAVHMIKFEIENDKVLWSNSLTLFLALLHIKFISLVRWCDCDKCQNSIQLIIANNFYSQSDFWWILNEVILNAVEDNAIKGDLNFIRELNGELMAELNL